MALTTFERFLPVSGIVAGLLFAGSALATADQPSLDSKKPQPYVDWIVGHHTEIGVSALCAGYFAFFMLMFAAQLRASIRAGEAGESTYSSVAFAGGVAVAIAMAAMSMLELATVEADAASVKVLAFLNDFSWLPWAVGSGAMMLGTGLGALRTLALPKWLAVTTVVLGILSVTGPTGIGVYLVTPFWLVTVGIVLLLRQRQLDADVHHSKALVNA